MSRVEELKRRAPEDWQAQRDRSNEEFQSRDLSIYPKHFQNELREHQKRKIDYMRELEVYFSRDRRPDKIRRYPRWIARRLLGL